MSNSPVNESKVKPLLRDTNLYMIFGVTLIAVMGVSTITPAFPKMRDALGITSEQVGLVITFFTLPGIVLTPLLGIIADRFGRKRILIPSLMLFGLAGAACALAETFETLLLLRFIQGIGGASLGSLNVTLIGDLYEGNRRATAMGYNSSVLSVGTAAYPAIGGAIAVLGWYFPFLLTLLAIPVGLMVLLLLDNPTPGKEVELKSYLINVLKTLRSKEVIGLFLTNFFTFILLFGTYLSFFPILLDQRFGQSSFVIGLLLSTSSLITALTASQLGKLSIRFTQPRLIAFATFLYVLAFILMAYIHNLLLLFVPIILFGIAQGINIPSVMNLLTFQAPMEYRAAFLSFNWMIMRGGQTLGPVLIGVIYSYTNLTGTFLASTGIAFILLLLVQWLVIK